MSKKVMKLPREIDSTHLTETIIEVRLVPNPDIDRDLWAGILVSKLSEAGYNYQNVPQLNILPEGENSIKLTIEKESVNSSINLFVNETDGVRVLLNEATISFNCRKGKYIGWDNYYKKVSDVLEIINAAHIALSYERTMIRYISEYDFNILEKVDIDVNSHSDTRYNTREISLSRQEGTITAYISISGLKERLSRLTQETRTTSLFDVNVFDKLPENASYNDVCKSLVKIHQIEKESFFGMLKEGYIESLNPKY